MSKGDPMTDKETNFTLRSGRTVAVHAFGAPTDGNGPTRTIVFFHAAPGAGNFDPDPAETTARNVRIIAVDRPGYGGSEPVTNGDWASVDRAVEDTVEVLQDRGIDRVNVVGWSAGGREAMALAARHPDLVERVAVIATPAPDEEVPWVPDEQRAGLDALRGKPAEDVHAALAEAMGAIVPADPSDPTAVAVVGGGPADESALSRDGARERVASMLTEAFAQGATGMAADVAGYALRPWGFEPGDVRQKALLIYGAQDKLAGARHGRWWQERLPDARLEMVPDAGHLVVVPMWKRVMSFLAPRR
jgi:pimeloyl-ACP methyl ester carboxylesterase